MPYIITATISNSPDSTEKVIKCDKVIWTFLQVSM